MWSFLASLGTYGLFKMALLFAEIKHSPLAV